MFSLKIFLKFGEIKMHRKKFHKSKRPISVNSVDTKKVVAELEEGNAYYIDY